MSDLSHLSDDELLKMYQQPAAQPSGDLSHLSNADLMQLASHHGIQTGNPDPQISLGESIARGASQSATGGFQDEASPWVERFIHGIDNLSAGAITGNDASERKKVDEIYGQKSYKDLRDDYRAQNDAAQKAHSTGYLTGQVAGIIPGAFATGGESLAGQLASNAGLAGLNAAGEYSDDDLSHLPDAVAKSALYSLPATAAGYGLGKLGSAAISKAGDMSESLANSFAVRSLGTRKKYVDQLIKKGAGDDLGRLVLDEGIVTPLSSKQDIAQKVAQKLKDTGEGIGEIDKQVDQFIEDLSHTEPGAASELQNTGDSVADSLRGNVIGPKSTTSGSVQTSENLDRYLAKEFEGIYGREPVSLAELRDFKGAIRERVNYFGNPVNQDSSMQAGFNDLSRGVEDKIDSTINKVSKQYGDGSLGKTYDNLKDRFGLLSQGNLLTQDTLGKLQSNRYLSPTDYIAGIGGYQQGLQHGAPQGVAMGLAGIAFNKFTKGYGNQIAASAFDKMAGFLQKSPQLLGNYGPMLLRAAQQGPSDLAVSHYVLEQTDPNYRQKLDEINKSDQ